jgi:hypothetical protein
MWLEVSNLKFLDLPRLGNEILVPGDELVRLGGGIVYDMK